jgi:hypothetical protein
MGGDWYNIVTYYGLVIDVPDDEDYRVFVSRAYKLQPFLDDEFKIVSLLTRFHSRMEGDECKDLDGMAVLFIGFKPSGNFDELARRAAQLETYVKDNIVFEGYDVMGGGQFFSGIKWDEDIWGMIEDEDEDEGDKYDDDADDDGEEDEEDDVSCEDSSEDECCTTIKAAGGAGSTR